jgi:hypothetical protein
MNRCNCEEINGYELSDMIAKKRHPGLIGLAVFRHQSRNRPFGNLKPELQQFSMDARRSPDGIGGNHGHLSCAVKVICQRRVSRAGEAIGCRLLSFYEQATPVIRLRILPTAKNNSNPLVSQSAHSGLMILAPTALQIVVGAGPGGVAIREFVEGLFHEFGTGKAMMDPAAVSALFGDGSDTGMRLQFDGRGPA